MKLQILIAFLTGFLFQVKIHGGFFILDDGDFQTGIHLFGPGLELYSTSLPVSQQIFLGHTEAAYQIRMIGKIGRSQEYILFLIDGHLTGTGFQRDFSISQSICAAGQKEKNQNEQ